MHALTMATHALTMATTAKAPGALWDWRPSLRTTALDARRRAALGQGDVRASEEGPDYPVFVETRNFVGLHLQIDEDGTLAGLHALQGVGQVRVVSAP